MNKLRRQQFTHGDGAEDEEYASHGRSLDCGVWREAIWVLNLFPDLQDFQSCNEFRSRNMDTIALIAAATVLVCLLAFVVDANTP